MTKQQKILLGTVTVGGIILIYLFYKHGGQTIVTPGAQANLPVVAATPGATAFPPQFILPGGAYVPSNPGNNGCCCGTGSSGVADNFLPASASALINLAQNDGPSADKLTQQVEAAVSLTDFTPQTSDLAAMILSRFGITGP